MASSGFPVDFDRTFDAWLPKFSVSHAVSGNTRFGALIQRAYNPGGTTLNLDTGEQDDFGAETLWNYEVFARTSFAGGRVTCRRTCSTTISATRSAPSCARSRCPAAQLPSGLR